MKTIIVVLLLIASNVLAQPRFTLRSGYGTYSMKQLKSFQAELKSQFTMPSEATEQFPGYIYFEGSFSLPVGQRINLGHDFTYGSTGGRIHYSDYSGALRADQLLNFSSFGTHATVRLSPAEQTVLLEVSLKASYIISNLELQFYQSIAGQTESEKFNFRSINGALQPDFSISKKFGRLGIHVIAGYSFTVLKGKLFLNDSDENFLLGPGDKAVKSEWDGVRLGFGVHYFFKGMDWWKGSGDVLD
jgi:hypothetical protein